MRYISDPRPDDARRPGMTPLETLQQALQPTAAGQWADSEPVLCTADTAECTCPEFCERDHDLD
jgi:hypothetical protein